MWLRRISLGNWESYFPGPKQEGQENEDCNHEDHKPHCYSWSIPVVGESNLAHFASFLVLLSTWGYQPEWVAISYLRFWHLLLNSSILHCSALIRCELGIADGAAEVVYPSRVGVGQCPVPGKQLVGRVLARHGLLRRGLLFPKHGEPHCFLLSESTIQFPVRRMKITIYLHNSALE